MCTQNQLGKKLKEARLIKKMTQSDVVGTFITRNMLSQIESGAASPSLRTLEYLANALEIPIHYLIDAQNGETRSDGDSVLEDNSKIINPPKDYNNIFLKCKAAYLRGDTACVIKHAHELDNESSLYYDERVALLSRAYLKEAKKSAENAQTKSAVAYARLAVRYGEVGIYASREVRTEALLLLDELSEAVIPETTG
ncbi:MAG: helix-turn-helix domain-containing protein [Oscillospiraceae bacterium]|nr:helix-turn-helix domain-containing protein [Oscillospiraceae bacterium]